MKTTISFGKIAYNNQNRKDNEATVEMELLEQTTEAGYKYLEFTASGNVWNRLHTDIVMGGQCLDDMAEYIHEPIFNEIREIWEKWHLNGYTAGTPEQMEAIRIWEEQGNKYDYNKVCEMLQDLDLYAVYFTGHGHEKDYNNEPYIYGTDWIVRDLPEDVIKRVTEIIEENNKKC